MGIKNRWYCFERDKLQDAKINQLKLEVHDTFEKD